MGYGQRELPTPHSGPEQTRNLKRKKVIVFVVALVLGASAVIIAQGAGGWWGITDSVAQVPDNKPSATSPVGPSMAIPSAVLTIGRPIPSPVETHYPPLHSPVPTVLPYATLVPSPTPPSVVYSRRKSCPFKPVDMTVNAEIVRVRDFGTWCYYAARDEHGLYITVGQDFSTVKSLQSYADTNKKIGSELALVGSPAHVLITFREPVKDADLKTWATAKGLVSREPDYPHWESMPTVTAGGWIQVTPLSSTSHPLFYQGNVTAQAAVSSELLPQIISDPLIFVADFTPNVIRQDLIDAGITLGERTYFDLASPWQEMHELGLFELR